MNKIAANKENRTILIIILAMLAIVIGGTVVLRQIHSTHYGTQIDLQLRGGK